MDRKKVALLGSACDPPTLAHSDLLDISLAVADEAWFMPCYGHPLGKHMASPEHRIAMCKLMERDRVKTFDYEIRNKLDGKTYYTVCRLLAEQPPYSFSFVIGMDEANSFPKWHNSDRLQQLIPFIVAPREGVKPDPDVTWYHRWPHVYLDKAKLRHTASHVVRDMLKDNDPKVAEHVAAPVLEYIRANHLYGT